MSSESDVFCSICSAEDNYTRDCCGPIGGILKELFSFSLGSILVVSAFSHALHSRRRSRLNHTMVTKGVRIPAKITKRLSGERIVFGDEEGIPNSYYKYLEHTMVLEFVNTMGETVTRKYPDARSGLVGEMDGVTICHLPEHPQSAYFDYGRDGFPDHQRGPSIWNYLCYGIVVCFGILCCGIATVGIYANPVSGLHRQGLLFLSGFPFMFLIARRLADKKYDKYEDDILRNLTENKQPFNKWPRNTVSQDHSTPFRMRKTNE